MNIKNNLHSILITLAVITSTTSSTLLADSGDGMVHIKSAYSVAATINKLENILSSKGMTIFKRVDHTAGAKKAGLQLRPTELLIFGNPM